MPPSTDERSDRGDSTEPHGHRQDQPRRCGVGRESHLRVGTARMADCPVEQNSAQLDGEEVNPRQPQPCYGTKFKETKIEVVQVRRDAVLHVGHVRGPQSFGGDVPRNRGRVLRGFLGFQLDRHVVIQAQVVNTIVDDLFIRGHPIGKRRLKEFVGHTPYQVFTGASLGVMVARMCHGGRLGGFFAG